MANAIAKAYARRVVRGAITLEDVPERIRAEVELALREMGWDMPSGDGGEE